MKTIDFDRIKISRTAKKLTIALLLCLAGLKMINPVAAQSLQKTVCNPIDISYRYCLDKPSRREAADPCMLNFRGEYYLFASKSGGYWHSRDLVKWELITSSELPLEDYAPTVVAIGDTVYFMASSGNHNSKIYKCGDLRSGKWIIANAAFPIRMTDPDLFLDDDGNLYLYYGCSNKDPIKVVELDRRSLLPLGTPVDCFNSDRQQHGWERPGDYNEKPEQPWIEGAWMTKYGNKYYLQYAAPATEDKSYCDGMYVADNPLGPFHLAPVNPFSAKPEGFMASAGHSSTFKDNYGNYWRVSTMTISINHRWERRLGLFPAFFGPGENAYAYTGLGDFPFILPKKRISSPQDIKSGWMLLSYGKPVQTSSVLKGFLATAAVDENVRTYWSAGTGNAGEWLMLDLQSRCRINALQVNFADHGTDRYGRSAGIYQAYRIEYSADRQHWKTFLDRTYSHADAPHSYVELPVAIEARYIRIINQHVPGGTFAISDLRIFGKDHGAPPAQVTGLQVVRDTADPCIATIKWQKAPWAQGYTIRYGEAPGKLYHTYQVLDCTALVIRSLNARSEYYFTIDSFNGTGVKRGNTLVLLK